MRFFAYVAGLGLMSLSACSTPPSTDVQQVFDNGPVDIPITDTGNTPPDTNHMCSFIPTEVNVSCRFLAQTCTTGPFTCDGGQSFTNSTCTCQTVHMGNQVWRCDNVCPSGVDAGDDATTDATADVPATDAPSDAATD